MRLVRIGVVTGRHAELETRDACRPEFEEQGFLCLPLIVSISSRSILSNMDHAVGWE